MAGARIGLLGGTFDPPHLGHLVIAECARVVLELDEVRFLVAGDPWMKADEDITAAAHRVEMTARAIGDDGHFVLDDRETSREGPTYTVETLEELRDELPEGTDLVFILGADQLESLHRWHRVDRALELARFVAAPRPGHEQAEHGRVEALAAPALDLSSTDLRRRFRSGEAVRYQVPASVIRYVERHDLYRRDHA